MSTSTANARCQVRARQVRFRTDHLVVSLEDGREVSLPLHGVPWLSWLARATPKQRNHWTIEPGGFAVYWPDLDDGVEVCHLLATSPVSGTAILTGCTP